jgi:hypothetical protein
MHTSCCLFVLDMARPLYVEKRQLRGLLYLESIITATAQEPNDEG